MTAGGLRPANAAGVGNNAPASGPYAGRPQTQRPSIAKPGGASGGSGNPFLDAINRITGMGMYAQAGAQGAQGAQAGAQQISTSITPGPVYTPQQTQEAANSAVASNYMPLPWLQSRYAGRGMSVNSPGVTTAVLPAYAQGLIGGQTASAQIPFQDTRADAQHILAGQTGRENEALGWSRLLSGADSVNRNFQMNSLQSLLSLLGGLM